MSAQATAAASGAARAVTNNDLTNLIAPPPLYVDVVTAEDSDSLRFRVQAYCDDALLLRRKPGRLDQCNGRLRMYAMMSYICCLLRVVSHAGMYVLLPMPGPPLVIASSR